MKLKDLLRGINESEYDEEDEEDPRHILSILPAHEKQAKKIIGAVLNGTNGTFTTLTGYQPEGGEPEQDRVWVLELKTPVGTCAIVKEGMNWTGWITDSISEFKSQNRNWEKEGTAKWKYSAAKTITRSAAIKWLNTDLGEFNNSDWGSYE